MVAESNTVTVHSMSLYSFYPRNIHDIIYVNDVLVSINGLEVTGDNIDDVESELNGNIEHPKFPMELVLQRTTNSIAFQDMKLCWKFKMWHLLHTCGLLLN